MLRRLTLLCAAVFGLGLLVPAPAAQALPACAANSYCLYQFYADPEHTIFTGTFSVNCDRTTLERGTRARYLVFTQRSCL